MRYYAGVKFGYYSQQNLRLPFEIRAPINPHLKDKHRLPDNFYPNVLGEVRLEIAAHHKH